jgi:hypothetical protein
MKRVLVLVAVLATAVLAWSTPAAADPASAVQVGKAAAATHTHDCVTRREYRAVKDGMRKSRVHEIFDFNGHLVEKTGDIEVRQYKVCKRWNDEPRAHVRVVFQNGRVVDKFKSW